MLQRRLHRRDVLRAARILWLLVWTCPLMSNAQSQPHAVEIVRDFNASPEKVWRAWTEPAWVSRWFGSNAGGRVLDARLDVRPGGHFAVTFVDADGAEHTCSGDYIDVQPFDKLSFTWHWKSEPGVETLVTVAFRPEGTGTRMVFEHSRLFVASAHDYSSGWRGTFDKLARVLGED
ncbi:MAG TPA: SRPBCC domain-containing protein [Povalibacter sp.]|nr:SRPBCC domain-containing protein [Povalibacter sp.]